jgi:hypothetical protein
MGLVALGIVKESDSKKAGGKEAPIAKRRMSNGRLISASIGRHSAN